MKTLLYATDLREETAPLLQFAFNLSKKLKVKLIVLHVYDLPPVGIPGYHDNLQIDLKVSDEQKYALKTYCYEHLGKRFSDNSSNVQIQAVEDSSVVNGILAAARSTFADLIIVGTKGKNSQRGLFAGNIARSLVDKVTVPLMIIPREVQAFKLQKIVYASALESKDIEALKSLVSLARPFLASINVLHVSVKSEFESEEQLLWFQELVKEGVDYNRIEYHLIKSEDIFDAINQYVDEIEADMLVMLERKERNLLRSLYHQDLVKKMQSSLSVPLVSFKLHE
jgi:nucleotide-binding universal stress UspA family protein